MDELISSDSEPITSDSSDSVLSLEYGLNPDGGLGLGDPSLNLSEFGHNEDWFLYTKNIVTLQNISNTRFRFIDDTVSEVETDVDEAANYNRNVSVTGSGPRTGNNNSGTRRGLNIPPRPQSSSSSPSHNFLEPEIWQFQEKLKIKCETEKFLNVTFKLSADRNSEFAKMIISIRGCKSNRSRLELTRIETCSIKMTLFTDSKETASASGQGQGQSPVVKYAQIENVDDMMETIESKEIVHPEIFLSIATFCPVSVLKKMVQVDESSSTSEQKSRTFNNRNIRNHNHGRNHIHNHRTHNPGSGGVGSGSGDFESVGEYIQMEVEIQAQFDIFVDSGSTTLGGPKSLSSSLKNKNSSLKDFEFRLARHFVCDAMEHRHQQGHLGLWSPSSSRSTSWTKKMLHDNFTDAIFHVGEEDKDYPVEVKAHKSVLAARSPVFEAMYNTDMEEKTSGFVKLPGVKVETMRAFLNCLYDFSSNRNCNNCNNMKNYYAPPDSIVASSSFIENDTNNNLSSLSSASSSSCFPSTQSCIEILQLAHKYQITDLVDSCVRHLIFTRMDGPEKITVQDALAMYTCAQRFDLSDLQARALLFLQRKTNWFHLKVNKEVLGRFMVEENDIAPELISNLFCQKNNLWFEPQPLE